MAACLNLASSVMARTPHIPTLPTQFLICLPKPRQSSNLCDVIRPVRCSPCAGAGSRNLVNVLRERVLVESLTSENLRSVCSAQSTTPAKVYCGFYPTAESLHLGNLIGIIVMPWFQRCGHKVVALIGGVTGRIGDPSRKSVERPELDVETVERNCDGIERIITGILCRNAEFEVISEEDTSLGSNSRGDGYVGGNSRNLLLS